MRAALVIFCAMSVPAGAQAGEGSVRGFCQAGQSCWAVGDAGLLLRSDDGGMSWQRKELDALAAGGRQTDLRTVFFDDTGLGGVFGGRLIPGHPGGAGVGVLLRTPDAGKTWKGVQPAGLGFLRGGRLDAGGGLAFGQPTRSCPSGIWATSGARRLWLPLRTRSGGEVLGGAFRGADACLVGPGCRVVLLKSLAESPVQPSILSGAALTAGAYAGEAACWLVGEDGSVFRIVPGQRAPQPVSLPLPRQALRLADLEAVASAAGQLYLAGGLIGRIFRAGEGGRSLVALPAPTPGPIHALARLGGEVLLAGGDGGRIWRSGDGGKSWRRVRGSDSVDVLFVCGPSDVSILPAVAAHAAAGAEVAIVFAAMPQVRAEGSLPGALRGELFLRSAASAAGARGAVVLSDFPSIAGDPDAQGLDAQAILKRWSAALDVPARGEMLRQLAAAIRLYRPQVVALGPDADEVTGTAAENHLVSRLAAEAVRLAADESALGELAEAGLPPWKVRRLYTGLDGNDRYVPPWAKRPPAPRQNVAAAFTGWKYPSGGSTSLSMLAMRAGWLLPWIPPADRPAEVTAYRCSEVLPLRPLFTSSLTPARLALEAAPMGDSLASGATLRAALLMRQNPAVAAAPLLEAAKSRPDDPLPADLLVLLMTHLARTGRLADAADVQRLLLAHGRAHPLFERLNVSAVAASASIEWKQQAGGLLERTGPAPLRPEDAPAHIRLPGRGGLKAALAALQKWPWRAWVDDEPGLILLAKAHAALGDFESARATYRQLGRASSDFHWQRFARVELTGLTDPAIALAAAGGFVLPATGQTLTADASLQEAFWRRAKAFVLAPAGGKSDPAAVKVRMAATPSALGVAVTVGDAPATGPARSTRPARRPGLLEPTPPPDPEAPAWQITLAVDADRDVWTQLVFHCDATGARALRLRTRLGPEASLPVRLLPVQARREGGSWTIELALPRKLLGLEGRRGGFVRMQVAVSVKLGEQARTYYLADQGDARLLPHRYALLAVPPAEADR